MHELKLNKKLRKKNTVLNQDIIKIYYRGGRRGFIPQAETGGKTQKQEIPSVEMMMSLISNPTQPEQG